MSNKNTYYDILEIAEVASAEDIRQAYHKLIKIWHPDLHPGDESAAIKTREINEAYEVLSDPVKKAQYDEYLLLTRPAKEETASLDREEDPIDVDYSNMTFEEYSEHISEGAYSAYKDAAGFRNTRFDEEGYRAYVRNKKPVRDKEVNIPPVMIAIIALSCGAVLILNNKTWFPELALPGTAALPMFLIVFSFLIVSVIIYIQNRPSKDSRVPEMNGNDSILDADRWFENVLRPGISKAECRDAFFSFSIRADRHILRRFEAMSDEDKEQYSVIIELLKDCIEYRGKQNRG